MRSVRSPNRQGEKIERHLAQLLPERRHICSRVPLSGIAGDAWSGDIHLKLLGRAYRIEVKARRAFTVLDRWLATADLLLLNTDTVLPVSLLAELAAKLAPTPTMPELAVSISFDPEPR